MTGPLRPALGNCLAPGIEAHPIRPISMQVTKQRALPATKAVVGHRHRQWNVHADHAHFNLVTEQTRRFTVTGEDARAVAVFVIVDQLHRRFQAIHPHHAQHRPEDLFFIDTHLRRHAIKQTAAKEETLLMPGNAQATAIDHQLSPRSHAVFYIATDLIPPLTSGPISRPHDVPAPIFSALTCGTNLAINASATWSPTQTATEIAMQRSPQEPYAAPIKALTALSRSASGISTAWFFAPPSACTRLPRLVASA